MARYLSDDTGVNNWENHIALREVVKPFGVYGEMGNGLKTLFTTMRISGSKHCIYEKEGYPWTNREG